VGFFPAIERFQRPPRRFFSALATGRLVAPPDFGDTPVFPLFLALSIPLSGLRPSLAGATLDRI
jgi:hypothetical protein